MTKQLPVDWKIRPATATDFSAGHAALLSQLTSLGDLDATSYSQSLAEICSQGSHLVVVENAESIVVGSATLLVEKKIIHGGAYVGHIEDVVVDASCRGRGIGEIIVKHLVDIARSRNCYKVILDCNEANVGFYEKSGFHRKEIQMRHDL